jgi:hypothetical protein
VTRHDIVQALRSIPPGGTGTVGGIRVRREPGWFGKVRVKNGPAVPVSEAADTLCRWLQERVPPGK